MRAGAWTGRVTTDNTRVTVNGTVRNVLPARIQSGMRDGHPAFSPGSWCVESTIDWVNPDDVTASSPSLNDDWVPKPGDQVVIETGDGALAQWWTSHVGFIDVTSGSITDGTCRSTTIDRIDDLSVTYSADALMANMPAIGTGPDRNMGLQATFMVDRMWRTAGWHATPMKTWETVGSATHMGSLWPEVGTLTSATVDAWVRTDYGAAPTTCDSDVALSVGAYATTSVILTAAIQPGGTGIARWRAYDPNDVGIELAYNATTDKVVVTTRGVATTQTWSLDRLGATRAAVHFVASTGSIILRLSDGRTTSGTATSAYPGGWWAQRVTTTSSDGARCGWWICEGSKASATRWAVLDSTPTARFRLGDMPWWSESRDIVSEDVAEWTAAQVDAECAIAWLNEDGYMQWAGRGVLESQPVAQTVTSALDFDDDQWEASRRHLAKRAVVTYLSPRVNRGWNGATTVTLWKDDGVDVVANEPETISLAVPADQDWVGVDLVPHHVKLWNQSWDYYSNGSTFGGTQFDKFDDANQTWALYLNCTMTRTGPRDYEILYAAWTTLSPSQRIKSSFPASTTAFMRTGGAVLNLRAKAQIIWTERETSATAGTVGVAEDRVDVGWRVQNIGAPTAIANLRAFRASVAAAPTAVDTVILAHDPRRQIGDKIRVEDRHVNGWWKELLVQQRDINLGAFTDQVTGRVVAQGPIAGLSLPTPAGHTALTPASNWTRSVA